MTIPTRRNRSIAERDAERTATVAAINARQALKDAACGTFYTAKVAVDAAVTAVETAITDEVANQAALDVLDTAVSDAQNTLDAAQIAYDAMGVDEDSSVELAALVDAEVAFKAAKVDQAAGLALMPAGAKEALVLAVSTYNAALAEAEALLKK